MERVWPPRRGLSELGTDKVQVNLTQWHPERKAKSLLSSWTQAHGTPFGGRLKAVNPRGQIETSWDPGLRCINLMKEWWLRDIPASTISCWQLRIAVWGAWVMGKGCDSSRLEKYMRLSVEPMSLCSQICTSGGKQTAQPPGLCVLDRLVIGAVTIPRVNFAFLPCKGQRIFWYRQLWGTVQNIYQKRTRLSCFAAVNSLNSSSLYPIPQNKLLISNNGVEIKSGRLFLLVCCMGQKKKKRL